MIKRDWDLLFSGADLDTALRHQLSRIPESIDGIAESQLLSTSDEQLVAAVIADLGVEPLELHEDKITVDSRDAKIDVSHDFLRGGWGDGPTYANGVEVTYHLPFSGDKELFKCRPSSFSLNPPRAVVGSGELRFPYDQPDGDVLATRRDFDEDRGKIREWVDRQRRQIDDFNASLTQAVGTAVAQRRAVLEKRKADLGALGFPSTRK